MTSRDLSLTNILNEDSSSFALTVASRLQEVTGVPLSRFSVLVANADVNNPTLACVSANSARLTSPENARYATLENTTFSCYATTVAQGGSLLQQEGRSLHSRNFGAGHRLRSSLGSVRAAGRVGQPTASVSWDVGIFLPTHLAGDDQESQQLATDMGAAQVGDMMPRRELLPNGRWSQRPGLGFRFAAIFPGTADTDVQINLGPNPGGHGAIALPRTPAPMEGIPTPEPPPMGEGSMLTRAHAINGLAGSSFYRLSGAIKAASRERYNELWGVNQPYAPFDPVMPSGALFPPWSGATR